MPEEVTETNTRTRIKLSQSTKGVVTWEISAEYDTPEKSIEMMSKALDKVKALIKEKGLTTADESVA
jgi:hypothetical protein